jgi:hypothetical protein
MSWHRIVGAGVFVILWLSPVLAADFGRRATPEEIKLWDIDVRADGKGLPEGSGSVEHGKSVFEENCSGCHGEKGVGGIKDRLVGGQGTLASGMPVKTVGSFWPYATTLFTSRDALPGPGLTQRRRHLFCRSLHPELEWDNRRGR